MARDGTQVLLVTWRAPPCIWGGYVGSLQAILKSVPGQGALQIHQAILAREHDVMHPMQCNTRRTEVVG